MTISDLVTILNGEVVACAGMLDHVVNDIAASDLLSDVLAFEKEDYALLTGLTNAQIVRTAEITNACCVVILRGKQPQPQAVVLAQRAGIPLIISTCSMFEACRRLGRFLEKADGRSAGSPDSSGT